MLFQASIIDNRLIYGNPNGFPKLEGYAQPDEAERRHLVEDLKLDPHTLESSLDSDETPRIEFEQDYTAVILKYPQLHREGDVLHFRVASLGFFFLPSGNTVAVYNEILTPRHFHGNLEESSIKQSKTAQDIFLCLLNQAIRHFELRLKAIVQLKNELTQNIIKSPKTQNLNDLFSLREGLVYFIDALHGNGHMIERILRFSEKLGFTQENRDVLEDYAIENQQFLEQAQVYSQVLTELMDSCNSILNNNLNITMKKMNFLVIAVSLPAFFTGFFGMSEFTTFTTPYMKWYVAYPLFLVAMGIISVTVYHLFKRFFK